MKCYSAVLLALAVVACGLTFGGALPLDDPLQCPLHCECRASDSEILLKCDSVKSEDPTALVADLTGRMEGLVTNLDVSLATIPTLTDGFIVGDREFSLLRILKLTECEIETIDPEAFRSASSLEEIDLSDNRLQGHIPADIFNQECPNLIMVSMKNNPMLDLPDEKPFLRSETIQELDLSGCGITKVHQQSFAEMPRLTYIKLGRNSIEFIHPEAFASLQFLEEINLNFNLIINAPPVLPTSLQILSLRGNPEFNVTSLTDVSTEVSINDLDISQCGIDELPQDVFYNLRDLNTLNISHNLLSELNTPFVLRQLRYLDLSNNKLSGTLDKNLLKHSSNLETLKLAWNEGLRLPEYGFLGDLSSLYLLDLAGCGLTEVRTASIDTLSDLATLNLSNNALQTLPPHIFRSLPQLTTLDLSHNDLNKIPNAMFEDNKNLRHLYLSHNENLEGIFKKDLLANNPELRTLDISYCSYTNLPEYLPEGLNKLNIAGNSMEHPGHLLKLVTSYLTNLKHLNIEDNPWKCSSAFAFLRNSLESKPIEYMGEKSWTDYHREICKQQHAKHKMAQIPIFVSTQNLMQTHFWSILTFLLTLTVCVVIAVVCTIIYRGCKDKVRSTGNSRYHTLSESPATSPSPYRVYNQTTIPILASDEKNQKELQPVVFTHKNSIFPRFPVTESDLPLSYVEGKYHHDELVP